MFTRILSSWDLDTSMVNGFVSTQSTILDAVTPKFVLNNMTEPYSHFGKRNVDLLDFFRHAFQPHRASQQPNLKDIEKDGLFGDEQHMRYVFGYRGQHIIMVQSLF